MKFTSEDLMKAMGLKVGDRVKFIVEDTYIGVVGFYGNTLSFIVENKNENETSPIFDLSFIIHEEIDFKILPAPKRVGDLKCDEIKECKLKGKKCPLTPVCVFIGKTPYERLEIWKESEYFDQEIYDILKDRLDKEVEE